MATLAQPAMRASRAREWNVALKRVMLLAQQRGTMMPAYLISDVIVRDPSAFEIYRTHAAASIKAFGGRYLVRGGETTVLEGQRPPLAIFIVEFPDMQTIRRWSASPEYALALEFRDQALSRSLIMVDGVSSF